MMFDLMNSEQNLRIPNLLNLKIDEPEESNPFATTQANLFEWNIEHINFRNITFDKESTTLILIEPSQKLKMHISNLCYRIDFQSFFMTNEDLFEYVERRNASIQYNNISVTVVSKLSLWNDTKALKVIIDQIVVNGKGDNIILTPEAPGFFINEFERFFDDSKNYIMQNIIQWMADFKAPIQYYVDDVLNKTADRYLNLKIDDFPPKYAFFGLVFPETQEYSPIIYDNFVSFTTYGRIFKEGELTQSSLSTIDEYQNTVYMPLYLNIDSALQIFVSQQSVNEFMKITQEAYQNQFNFTSFNPTTETMDIFLEGFSKTFGKGLNCMIGVKALNIGTVSIAAGDVYLDPNAYEVIVYVQNAGTTENFEAIRLRGDVGVVIFGFEIKQNLTYKYQLKNYQFNSVTISYSSKPDYQPDISQIKNRLNNDFKKYLKDLINYIGDQPHVIDPVRIFGDYFADFWSSFFSKSSLNLKHDYFQIQVERQQFQNYSLFIDLMYKFLGSINNTNLLDSHANALQTFPILLQQSNSSSDFNEKELVDFKTELTMNILSLYGSNHMKKQHEFEQDKQKRLVEQYRVVSKQKNLHQNDHMQNKKQSKKDYSIFGRVYQGFGKIRSDIEFMKKIVYDSIYGTYEEYSQ
eukprot:403352851